MRVRQDFVRSQRSIAESRRFAQNIVADLPVDLRDAVALMVSELATNALVHTAQGFEMTIDRTKDQLQVSVADRSHQVASVQSPSPSEPHGRGLRIVKALSDTWGTTDAADGKTVWFQVNLITNEMREH
jgi:anti-sigma regulatory factor (Ser/Thr protein kinase)